jgi:tryptophan-rich sensory protein
MIPLWLSVLAVVIELSRLSTLAGWLAAPYLAWVTFAGWLNWRMVQLNKPFGRRTFGVSASPKVRGNGGVSS